MNTLQSLVLPNLEVCSEEAMYLRPNALAWSELATLQLHFLSAGTVSTDTFYNGLTVSAWKTLAEVRTLVLTMEGNGRFVVTFGLHRRGQATLWVGEEHADIAPGETAHMPVRCWERLTDGMLFYRVRAVEPGVITAARYQTRDAPLHAVKLGVVITHFNRTAQVLPAIERIRASVLTRPELQGDITLTVVDNSRNLALAAQPNIERIPNRNLGGTGGFVRGLLSLVDGGTHTHALFMDDDASCEAESIARTHALLRYARDPRQCVAGALLRELAPWHLLEKGARFDGEVRPICGGLDVRHVEHLLEAENPPVPPDYAAWWFFAFPLAEVRHYPFPFFVRGDDIHFGLSNRFKIATLNGVACFGEDFSSKHSPLTAYLDARYHLVLALLGPRPPGSRLYWIASRLFLKQLNSYHYSSARAVTLALKHVMQGPGFFRDNLNLQAVRSEIAGWVPNEKLLPLDGSALDLRGARRTRESKWRRLGRLVTLQGFLLPDALIKNRTTVQDKAFHGNASAVFRYRRVLYRHLQSGTGYLVEYDRPRFFAELNDFVRTWLALRARLPALRRDFAAGAAAMSTAAFWRSVYAPARGPGETPLPVPEAAALNGA